MAPEKLANRLQILLSDTELARIDEWRESQPAKPSRNATIRALIEKGFEKLEEELSQRTKPAKR